MADATLEPRANRVALNSSLSFSWKPQAESRRGVLTPLKPLEIGQKPIIL